MHLGIDCFWHLARRVRVVCQMLFLDGRSDLCTCVLVQSSADSFLYFSFSVLNRIVWKRLTWRGRTKLIPSRNKSLSWNWRRWVDGNRSASLVSTFTTISSVLLHGFWHMCVHCWERVSELWIPKCCFLLYLYVSVSFLLHLYLYQFMWYSTCLWVRLLVGSTCFFSSSLIQYILCNFFSRGC